jgi:hypothetical protein
MNHKEYRALRAIEKQLTVDDPVLAELLRRPVRRRRRWLYHFAGWLAIAFSVIGFALGDAVYLLIAGLLASGAVFGWTVQAVRNDELDRDRK